MFLMFAIALSSCKKDFLSLETNPNTPSVSSPNLLLSGALKTSAGIINGGGYVMYANWVGYLSHSTSFQVNVALEQYQFTTSTYDLWTPLYLNIANYNALLKSDAGPNYNGIAKIMIVYNYQQLVDNYNNVPYSQAIQGADMLSPAYDSGSAIYDDLMKQLDAAIVILQAAPATAANPGSADIMYKGKMINWIKFANTLKLRLAIRQSNVTAKAVALKSAVAATSSIGYLDATNPALVNPGYANVDASGGQQSPLVLNYGVTAAGASQANNSQYQANAYATNFYSKNNDPRLLTVYKPSITVGVTKAASVKNGTVDTLAGVPGVGIVGTPFGGSTPPNGIVPPKTAEADRSNLAVSKFGVGVLKGATMNATIMSAAEALFLQAEGVASGLISGNAKTLYDAGIAASFADDLVPNAAAAAATYSAQTAIAYPVGASLEVQKKAIITQKWAALNPYGAFEAFNELRRTGYPDNIPLSIYPGANAPNQVTRIFYPFVEYQTNSDNVAAQGTIDKFTSKIFWAK